MRLSTEEIISEYWQSIYAVAFNVCKNQMDAEDVAQDTFVKYHMHNKQFDNKEHLRAWLIKVTINAAKNNIKSFWRKVTYIMKWKEDVRQLVLKKSEFMI